MAKEVTLNVRLQMVRSGMDGLANRVRRDLEGLEKCAEYLPKDATVLALFKTCIRSIRAEMDQLTTPQDAES